MELEIGQLRGLYDETPCKVTVTGGLTTLVGPNGVGKTQILRGLAEKLKQDRKMINNRYVRFLSSGRNSPFERFRSSIDGPGQQDRSQAAIGHSSYRNIWWEIESVTGDYLALQQRPDLLLKVQARLEHVLKRTIQLVWTQQGLAPIISNMTGGSYNANDEASGILQLVPMLAAIYNDEIGALLIDEPELSLHPQYQAFLLDELDRVAGDPLKDPTKKFVVIATHSPSMLKFNCIADLPNFIFANSPKNLPVQIKASTEILLNRKLGSLIARASATHRMLIFAESIFLVEGPSDEIIITQLARTLKHTLAPTNTQILPITGKGEFIEVTKLLWLMGKQATILADLDALADSNDLINLFSQREDVQLSALASGHTDIAALDRSLRSSFAQFIETNWQALESTAVKSSYWKSSVQDTDLGRMRRRAILSQLLGEGPKIFDLPNLASELTSLLQRYQALLSFLASGGCFFLRRGAIENYFVCSGGSDSKPNAAATEATKFDAMEKVALSEQYNDVLVALRHAAPGVQVDEAALLRRELAGLAGSLLQSMEITHTDVELNSIIGTGQRSSIFSFSNKSRNGERRISINLVSSLFVYSAFPFEIGEKDNLTAIIRDKITNIG